MVAVVSTWGSRRHIQKGRYLGVNLIKEASNSADAVESTFVPSAFSPNGDGKNDYFIIPTSSSIRSISSFQVFDRTGSLIYNTVDNDHIQWDGTINGKIADKGVYVYVLQFTSDTGEQHTKSGSISLIR